MKGDSKIVGRAIIIYKGKKERSKEIIPKVKERSNREKFNIDS